MALLVQKFGGTSVGDLDRIRSVARRVVETLRAGNQVVVCVSAMSGETNALVALAGEIGGASLSPREYDVLVSTGEQKSIALLSMAIHALGVDAQSFTGSQMGLLTALTILIALPVDYLLLPSLLMIGHKARKKKEEVSDHEELLEHAS